MNHAQLGYYYYYLKIMYVHYRLRVKRVEAEKEELVHELERLRELTNNGENTVDVVRNYDKCL